MIDDIYNYPMWDDEDKDFQKDDKENIITIKINYHWEILIEKMLKAFVMFIRNKFGK